MGQPALSLSESPETSYSGFGKNVVKLTNPWGQMVCIISDEDTVWFPRVLTIDEIVAVAELLQKRKMKKAIHNHDYARAQEFADRKFGG